MRRCSDLRSDCVIPKTKNKTKKATTVCSGLTDTAKRQLDVHRKNTLSEAFMTARLSLELKEEEEEEEEEEKEKKKKKKKKKNNYDNIIATAIIIITFLSSPLQIFPFL